MSHLGRRELRGDMGTTRKVLTLITTIYHYPLEWSAAPAHSIRYRVTILGTPTGKGGNGPNWNVENISCGPPMPNLQPRPKGALWAQLEPLLAQAIREQTGKEPRGLMPGKMVWGTP